MGMCYIKYCHRCQKIQEGKMSMKYLILLALLPVVLMTASCRLWNADVVQENSDATLNFEETNKENNLTDKEILNLPKEFSDPFVEGNLCYSVSSCKTVQKLSDADIKKKDLLSPHNVYGSQDTGEKYQKADDYIEKKGNISASHVLVVLELEVKNRDAVGIEKKNEFNVANISLYGKKTSSQYHVAYFSEAGRDDLEQPLHFKLEQGKSMHIRLAYFMLKEDAEQFFGMISDSDVQFRVKD